MKKIVQIIFILLVIAGIAAGIMYLLPKKHVHFHAGFQIYVDGKLQDFSSYKYMKTSPCGKEEHVDEQLEKAHLHDGVGDVIHIHREHTTWGDFFKNINYTFDTTKPIEAYVQGKRASNILGMEIHPYDSAVIFIGNHDALGMYFINSVKRAHMEEVEKKSESCGSSAS